jgi:dienelactone hydrolase
LEPLAAAIASALSRSVLEKETALKEVRAFCMARIPDVPAAATAEDWRRMAEGIRREMLDKVVFRGEARKWRNLPLKVEWLDTIEGGDGYKIKKLRYEAVPGLWIPALLYTPDRLGDLMPVFLNVNGHDPKGKQADYKQVRCINMAKRGMLVLNPEWLGMGQLRAMNHYQMNQLDLCGTSGLSVFYLAMKKGIDVLMTLPQADPKRVGVSGLSGGGWQTIFLSSLDERVTLSNPVAGYSSFKTRVNVVDDLGDSEQTPCDMATVADYTHLTAIRAPRPTLLTYNEKDDCCFKPVTALPPLLGAARPVFEQLGAAEKVDFHINHEPGTHNFFLENREALYKFIGTHWYPGDKSYGPKEFPSDSEVKTAEELSVPIPAENATFNSLARALAEGIRKSRQAVPAKASEFEDWRRKARLRLGKVLRAPKLVAEAEAQSSEQREGVGLATWRIKMGEWTVPCTEIAPASAKGTTILLGDEGRAKLAVKAAELVRAGQRVLAIDPLYFGEAQIATHPFLYALLIGAVGERPLGIQAAQVAAVARWAKTAFNRPVSVHAEGPRASLFALCAGGLEPAAILSVVTAGAYESLEEPIRRNLGADKVPEMLCFGLLAEFDMPELRALAGQSH